MEHRSAPGVEWRCIVGRTLALVGAAVLCLASACSAGGKPAVAIDGTIVFSAPQGAYPSGSDIYLLDAQGTRRLARDAAFLYAYPVWSPDGSQIAYITETEQLAVVMRDGSEGATLTPQSDDPSLWAQFPAWLPDGNISVVSAGKLAVLRPDGSGVKVLEVPGIWNGYDWSPDGTQIVYPCWPAVCLFDVGRGESRTLLDLEEILGLDVGEFSMFDWSPDGTKIMAAPGGSTRGRHPATDVYIFDADGQGLHALPQPGGEENPAWSPDGTMIVFQSNAQERTGLWVMNADGSGAQELFAGVAGEPGIYPREADWTGN